jgi:hypothetical protein
MIVDVKAAGSQTSCYLSCRERETKLRFRDSQRGLGGSYMRTAVTTLQLLLELVSDEQVHTTAGLSTLLIVMSAVAKQSQATAGHSRVSYCTACSCPPSSPTPIASAARQPLLLPSGMLVVAWLIACVAA